MCILLMGIINWQQYTKTICVDVAFDFRLNIQMSSAVIIAHGGAGEMSDSRAAQKESCSLSKIKACKIT